MSSSEYIISTFSKDLQRVVTEKKVTQDYGGVPTYVQEVLIPEILSIFVAEDMDVGRDEARSILEKSREIGEILNADDA